jgi:2,4-dienoyl-CoA reductase-like NADH-dependent reductase (Old Yellow Enzyme family)
MPPMGVHWSDDGAPGMEVAAYYRRRAEGGAGLIITEGTFIDHPVAGHNPGYLRIDSEAAVRGWTKVVRQVHEAGGRIMPELWHCGLVLSSKDLRDGTDYDPAQGFLGPSGCLMPGMQVAPPMTEKQIEDVNDSFVRAARDAVRAGFDGIELHGAHGFLIDQFFWHAVNRRTDGYGGSMRNRARFGAEVVAAVRRAVGPDMPIAMRISQWKMQDYNAKVAQTPQELADWLEPLVDAGVDLFDCSQRRFWSAEFEGSDLTFSGWTRKLSGKPVITVGSVGLDTEMPDSLLSGNVAQPARFERLIEMLERGDFDLVAVGRSLIADPDWPRKIARIEYDKLVGFTPQILKETSPTYSYL